MSTIETEGDGDGIEAPLDVPVPPGFNEDELEEIVNAASEMIERDMRRGSPAPAPEPAPEPTPAEAVDEPEDLETDPQEADEPPTPTSDVDGEGAEAASDPGKAVAAPSGSEAVGDNEPADPAADPTSTATADPGTEPAPEVDEWTRAGDAWERLYGQRPTFDQLQGIAVSATNYSNLLSQIQQLPQEHQQVLGDIIRGTFDPAAYAAQHAPTPTRDRDYDPLYDDPTGPAPQAAPQNDEVVRELRELRAAQERQQQDEYARTVQSDLARLQQDFLAANPHLAPEQFEQIALSVNRAGTWTNELQTRGAYDAYGRHLLAHAVAAGYDVNPPGAPATPTTSTPTSAAPAPTPTPAEHPVPADEHPLSAEEQAHAQRRQAAAAAVSGSSSPARATKRSVLDVDTPGHPSRPRTGHDLQAELVRAAEEMGLG